jgi:hypothetical protein
MSALRIMGNGRTYAIIVADSLEDPAVILSEAIISAPYFKHVWSLLTFDAPLYW